MFSKSVFLLALIVKAITSQRLPPYFQQFYPETAIDRYVTPQLSTSDSDIICKNLATAIQNAMFDRFAQNCLRTPVFGPMAGPLVNDVKNTLCQCPRCSSVNVSPNGYTKSYVSPNAVSNIIRSTIPNTVTKQGPRINPNVSLNRQLDLISLLNGYGCDCGCRGPVVI